MKGEGERCKITGLWDDEILYKFGHFKLPRVLVDTSLSVLSYYFW